MGPLVAYEHISASEIVAFDNSQVIEEWVATRSPIIETGRPMS